MKQIKKWNKILKDDKNYDFSYLLRIEKFKLSQMIKCFSEFSETSDKHLCIRDMSLCVQLITIALQEDFEYKWYLTNYVENKEINPIHINIKNYKRFWKIDSFNDIPIARYELRTIKALYLYNKIRNRIFRWWF